MTSRGQIEKAMARIEAMKNTLEQKQTGKITYLLARLSDDELNQMERLLRKERDPGELSPEDEEELDGLYLRMLRVESGDMTTEMLKLVPAYVGPDKEPESYGTPVRCSNSRDPAQKPITEGGGTTQAKRKQS